MNQTLADIIIVVVTATLVGLYIGAGLEINK